MMMTEIRTETFLDFERNFALSCAQKAVTPIECYSLQSSTVMETLSFTGNWGDIDNGKYPLRCYDDLGYEEDIYSYPKEVGSIIVNKEEYCLFFDIWNIKLIERMTGVFSILHLIFSENVIYPNESCFIIDFIDEKEHFNVKKDQIIFTAKKTARYKS